MTAEQILQLVGALNPGGRINGTGYMLHKGFVLTCQGTEDANKITITHPILTLTGTDENIPFETLNESNCILDPAQAGITSLVCAMCGAKITLG